MDKGIKEIGESLKVNLQLEILEIRYNKLGNSTALILKEVLSVNKGLKYISLGKNKQSLSNSK